MQVSNEVLTVLSAARVEGSKLFLVGALPRPLYVATDKVLQAAGGKWDKKAKAHVFDGEAEARIDQIIVTGSIVIPKDEYEFFPTPPTLVERMLTHAELKPGQLVLEPSAGDGAIALAAAKAHSSITVDCYELMPANHAKLVASGANGVLGIVTIGDFLEVTPTPIYDRVLMNPPFSKQQDIKHITHAYAFLKPGGILVAIAGAGVAFRQDKRATDFRALVDHANGSITHNAEGSFKSSGTSVNTVMIVMEA